jgi:predicted transcriptional regulator
MPQTYTSSSNTFTLEYPDDWKTEKEQDGTLRLCKKVGLFKKDSPYSLRITPMVSDEIISPEAYKALLTIRRKQHQDLQVIESDSSYIMNFHILKYKKEVYQDVGERTYLMIQDYWELIISNRIFTCWFGAKQGEENSTQFKEEKAIAEKILFSIKLL